MSGLVGIGRRAERDRSVVGRLRDCHGRIRSMLALAQSIAGSAAADEAEVAEAATRVHRYFATSLPLHLRDEEESIKPRLLAAEALELMSRQHADHERLLQPLLRHWAALAADPRGDRQALRAELATLTADLEAHLRLEETVVFPAIEALPADAQTQIVAEMETRRA
jgi:iron-sulfur cluster repair protein YtfE (RIC family)